jgi:hypothetical protein
MRQGRKHCHESDKREALILYADNVCGRYQRRSDKQRIAEAFALGNVDGVTLELTPDYNVAPQTMQPVIVWDVRAIGYAWLEKT